MSIESVEATSRRIRALQGVISPVYRFFVESPYARRSGEPNINDFAVGNPHEMPLQRFVEALRRWAIPENKDWYAYKDNTPWAREVVSQSLRQWHDVAFEPDDVFLTNGAFAALAVTLGAIVDPGDEVIFISPPWFFYEALIAAAGGTAVRVRVRADNFDLDLDAIAAAITPRTRAIIVNSPNNPTGKIYPAETLAGLSGVLAEASQRNARPIYLLSDEAYGRIVYGGIKAPSPATFYPRSFLIYTYGKVLLAPGQRVGYIALPPDMPDRAQLRHALFVSQLLTGFSFPNALLQHALASIECLSIDLGVLERKRDLMVGALRQMGYDVHTPEGTFYLLPRSPWADDWAFTERLAEHDILVLPGTVVEMPGYFRLSLTANDQMIERALPGFAAALQSAPPA